MHIIIMHVVRSNYCVLSPGVLACPLPFFGNKKKENM